MRLEINFTDEELLDIIATGCPESEVIFAEEYELPEAYPSLNVKENKDEN